MHGIFSDYMISPQTWFFHALLLIIAVYFRFNRLWSIRNLDLLLLLGVAGSVVLPAGKELAQSRYSLCRRCCSSAC